MKLDWGRLSPVQRYILEHVAAHPSDVAKVTAARFNISRQAVNRQLRHLSEMGVLAPSGETRRREYKFAELGKAEVLLSIKAELREDAVWREHVAPVLAGVPENVLGMCQYGLTEMVNNAIDHSGSANLAVRVTYTAANIEISVADWGIGIFRKIKEACGLEDERHAILELVKGKLTTDPERHTGEGIFFTSRMFDSFGLLSGELYLGHRRHGGDWLLEDRTIIMPGTTVTMQTHPQSKHTTTEIFERYATEQDDYAFNRTHVVVALAQIGSETLVSRSQAKRVMARLDRFREIVLDFQGVESIGPAFADEMFRVFSLDHPQIRITPIRMTEEVAKMVRRATTISPSSDDISDGANQQHRAAS